MHTAAIFEENTAILPISGKQGNIFIMPRSFASSPANIGIAYEEQAIIRHHINGHLHMCVRVCECDGIKPGIL